MGRLGREKKDFLAKGKDTDGRKSRKSQKVKKSKSQKVEIVEIVKKSKVERHGCVSNQAGAKKSKKSKKSKVTVKSTHGLSLDLVKNVKGTAKFESTQSLF